MGHLQRLTEAKVVAAPLAVMRSADEIVAPIFEKILAIKLESSALTVLRDALLPKLLRGEIWVKDAERLVLQHVPNTKKED